ncbi:MAG: UDP-N-acetylglucosamine 2-epimerase [Actinobacteria bacterium]|nr:UDP-N-acetylglucosamine 2-epimerase [Actinomycetota bacterium]
MARPHVDSQALVILVVYGTTGELIKLAPVLNRLRQRGHAYLSATTAQQVEQIPPLLQQLELPAPDLWLGRGAGGRDLRTNSDVPRWLATVLTRFVRHGRGLRHGLRAGPGKPLVLVHGDTMTTVLGASMGRALRTGVAHIEGGLRSYDWRNPFPEELNRRAASRLARIHYAPGSWAASNLKSGTIVDTGSNTIRDSLQMVPADFAPPVNVPDEPYGVVSIHRYELLGDRDLLAHTLDVLEAQARRMPLLFVDHPVTAAAIDKHGLASSATNLRRIPRLTFFPFIALLRGSEFLFTDSGGSQEECYYLDHPALIHRMKTERREGLGENVVLSKFDFDVVRDFLSDPSKHRRTGGLPDTSPSDAIVADLVERGFV